MEIKLKGNYIITADSRQYILSKWSMGKDKKGNPKMQLRDSTYHSTLEQLLKAYKEKYIRASECKTIDEVLELCKKMDAIIEEILEGN